MPPAAASASASASPTPATPCIPIWAPPELDLSRDRDVIDGDDAIDDLIPNPAWPLPNPGHGTRTASVIVGEGRPTEGIVGLAGGALLVPIRATESVVQLFDSDVAKAVARGRWAVM